jgi:hypothetical protein
MTKFKLYEDILSRSWNRYFYDVEANTIEEAVEKVRYEEVDCYDSEQIYEVIDELDPVDNNGSPTREIYNDKDELIWHNAELVNRGEIITQSLRNISKNLLSIMADEPEVFEGRNISLSLVKEVMKDLGYEANDSVSLTNCTYQITYTKPGKNFSYQIIGDIYNGNISIEKKYER